MTTPQIRRLWLRLGQVAGLTVMAMLGIIDVRYGMLQLSLDGLVLSLVRVGLAVATVRVWLPEHPQNSRRLPSLALLLAAASIAVTVATLTAGFGLTGVWGLAETCGLLASIYVVARRGAPRSSVAAVLALGLAGILLPLRGAADDTYVIAALLVALGVAGATAGGAYLRFLDRGREQVLVTMRAEQRAEFARELHDFIAHHVTGIVVQAQGARFIAEQDPQRAILALEQIEQAGAETMNSMRRMVGVLRDPHAAPDAPLTPLAGLTELNPLLAGFNGSGAPVAHLHVDGDLDGIPVEVSTTAYRVVMEALTNTRRHAAGARSVDVQIFRGPESLFVRVTDDGATPRAAGPRRQHRYGLMGLTERVHALGGRFSAGPGAGGGWVVDAALPLDHEAAR
ncbi:sensor histidine kinase [Microbispora bryophytorum]|uniref:histidine kinase n=1 Tax=Microbispora bryophytorum subsp. camponoti TaxID=1677852 RepID=A0ABR8LCT9_9ACTN|nr:histidine kinase [Microbispora camponoti]MBD3148031.1 two-component sensor histidine kinase [Microbispora camponoti]